jgi:hypothetical protein
LERFSDSTIASEAAAGSAGSSMANLSSEVGRVYDGFTCFCVIFVLLSH